MSAKPLFMSLLKQLLRLRSQGCGIKEIARQTGNSRNTVRKYLHLADTSGYSLEVLLNQPDTELESRLMRSQPALSGEYQALEAKKEYFLKALKEPYVTRWHLWGEYRQAHPAGYGYTQFCHYLRQWELPRQAVMHLVHKPGEKLFIDFTGDKLSLVDPHTGELQEVEVLVAVLGYSQYTYVEAVASQKLEDFLEACQRALRYFGGSPKVIIPDNLKSAVTKADRYDPQLNEAFADFSNHYQMAVMPTRPYKPRDKGLAENGVINAYRRIFVPLREQRFFSLAELNKAISQQLARHNQTPFQLEPDSSRQKRFVAEEQHLLRPLPAENFSLKRMVQVTVMKNCHVRLSMDQHYYSVPYRYLGQKVLLQFTSRQVNIFHQHQLIAVHVRDRRAHRYTTVKEHLPSTHQYISEWSEGYFLEQASKIDPVVKDFMASLLATKRYPEQGYKSCSGVLALARKTEKTVFVAACRKAIELSVFSYPFLKRMLENGFGQLSVTLADDYLTPPHENIRGAAAYQ